ncbi:tetratricopeptide repeat protein [Azotobacter vinelandii]|uniref:tetratricopeptide repeat protein n=1 Tax=Azotobacter vinelandii TaxID=354 RepID=UPI001E332CB6|nr:tetratricopeptide repeat protein [Azotobacter vinelandii]
MPTATADSFTPFRKGPGLFRERRIFVSFVRLYPMPRSTIRSMSVKSRLALGSFVAGILACDVALAARLRQDWVAALEGQGWLAACPQVMADASASKEPAVRGSEEWRNHMVVAVGCLFEMQRDAELIAFLNASLTDGHRDPELLDFLGTSQLRLGRNAEAAATFEEALENGLPDQARPNVYGKLGTAYLKLASAAGAPDDLLLAKAERYAGLAVDSDLTSEARAEPMTLARLGHVKLLRRDYDEAIRLFDAAVERNAADPAWSVRVRKVMEAWFTAALGQAHYGKGDKAHGEDLMNKAIEIAPGERLKTALRTVRDGTLGRVSAGQAPMPFPVFHVPLDEDA